MGTSDRCRGSALVECAVVTLALVTVVTVVTSALYVHFVRAWFEYASEQSLYCAAERRPPGICRDRLRRTVVATPFVRRATVGVTARREHWRVRLTWTIGPFAFGLNKSLTARRISRGADLR